MSILFKPSKNLPRLRFSSSKSLKSLQQFQRTPFISKRFNHHQDQGILLYPSISLSTKFQTGVVPTNSDLLHIAREGNVPQLASELERGGNVNQISSTGFTPLHAACQQGNVHMVTLLLDHGASTDTSTMDTGLTPLMIASSGGHQDIVQILLDRGCNPNIVTLDNGATALIEASREGSSGIVKLLIERGADPNIVTRDTGESAMMIACELGHQDVVRELLVGRPDLTLVRSTDGSSALGIACQMGHVEVVELLLKSNQDIVNLRSPDKIKGEHLTPLLQAVLFGRHRNRDVIQMLVKYHANVEEAVLLSKNWGMNPQTVADKIVSSMKGAF